MTQRTAIQVARYITASLMKQKMNSELTSRARMQVELRGTSGKTPHGFPQQKLLKMN